MIETTLNGETIKEIAFTYSEPYGTGNHYAFEHGQMLKSDELLVPFHAVHYVTVSKQNNQEEKPDAYGCVEDPIRWIIKNKKVTGAFNETLNTDAICFDLNLTEAECQEMVDYGAAYIAIVDGYETSGIVSYSSSSYKIGLKVPIYEDGEVTNVYSFMLTIYPEGNNCVPATDGHEYTVSIGIDK